MEGDDQQVAIKINDNMTQYFWNRHYRWFCLIIRDNECSVIWSSYKKPLLIGVIDNKWVYRNVYIENPISLQRWFLDIWNISSIMNRVTKFYELSQSDYVQPQGSRYY